MTNPLSAAGPPSEAPAAFSFPDATTLPRPRTSDAGPQQGTDATDKSDPVAVLILVDLEPGARLWGWTRIVRGAGGLRGTPGLQWVRVMGSGYGGGFSLRPSLSHQGVFAVFENLSRARQFLASSPLVATYRARSLECCTVVLRAWSSRGRWAGEVLPVGATPVPAGPVAALTRASIRPLKARGFWAMAPASQAALADAPGCRLAAGLGEAPLLRQCTFSLWDSVAALEGYAHSGAHLQAIRASAAGGFFSESMFVRFSVLSIEGRWQGRLHG